jgi:hypothetical protein
MKSNQKEPNKRAAARGEKDLTLQGSSSGRYISNVQMLCHVNGCKNTTVRTITKNLQTKNQYRTDNQNIRPDIQDNRPGVPKHTVRMLYTK